MHSVFAAAPNQAAQPVAAPQPQTITLPPEREFRIEIEQGKTVKLRVCNFTVKPRLLLTPLQLVEGSAEWFGTELARDHDYTFSGINGYAQSKK